ncbi:MAG: hypothetical protein HYY05_00520 [Chloroflexi bacterium]|nr:hypothetical protein [Chloroflexota bacterium]
MTEDGESVSYVRFLDDALGSHLRAVEEELARATRTLRALQRAARDGDVNALPARAAAAAQQAQQLAAQSESLPRASSFDFEAYCAAGGFHAEFSEACDAEGLALEGQFPSYEVFPLRIRVNAAERFATIEGRRVRSLRPRLLAQLIARERQRLEARRFNARPFLEALALAYDTVVALRLLKRGGQSRAGLPMPILEVYRALTLLPGSQAGYSRLMFAYDFGRLLRSGELEVDGRLLQPGSSRNAANALRIIDPEGHESHFATIALA